MEIIIGLLIIAAGAFCQSSCYVPINKIKGWSWESYWMVQGVFAWVLLPLLGAFLAVPAGHSLIELFTASPSSTLLTIGMGVLWGIGGLTFGLSMRYLGVALGQSIALGTCAGLGTILGPVALNIIYPGQNMLAALTWSVIAGVAVTLAGIAVIGLAGAMKSASLSQEEKTKAVKEFNFPKGIVVALICGLMSACFAVGLAVGGDICFDGVDPMFQTLPATFLVTIGGFLTNAAYCLYQNSKNKTWSDYGRKEVWLGNVFFCLVAGALWYSQFFGLSLGKGFLASSPVLLAFAWCILMALNVVFSNLWGIILKEWKGCSRRTIATLVAGLVILVVSTFLPQIF